MCLIRQKVLKTGATYFDKCVMDDTGCTSIQPWLLSITSVPVAEMWSPFLGIAMVLVYPLHAAFASGSADVFAQIISNTKQPCSFFLFRSLSNLT